MSQTHYRYDGLNRLTQLTDSQNTLSFNYDKVGRLTEQRQWQMNDSGFANSQVIGYHSMIKTAIGLKPCCLCVNLRFQSGCLPGRIGNFFG
ncbi:RHS repeat protein [Pelistega sp. NLN82]|uniref:RHS repeat protein n=1 Tax=Pelistega ratti TaxID=2652177 RepID=A0A6L9Y730_9BURK|nr:RHS repeat domain-containing protein [Pelistega ratti]NEN76219.1 RHS repeat protein [Pelistega ratti]